MKRLARVLRYAGIILLLLVALGYCLIRFRSLEGRAVAAAPMRPVRSAELNQARATPGTIMGWQGVDLSQADFSPADAPAMWNITFSTETKWPDPSRLPPGFDPAKTLEIGKDPGLGIRGLHQRGITGKGIHVAVIDNPMRQGHQEFAGRMTYTLINPLHMNGGWIHFHGAATASILGGKTVGVAPESYLHFYATPGTLENFGQIAAAIDKILAYNQGKPREQQIRVISISMGMRDAVFMKAIEKAEAAGIAVVHCGPWFQAPYIVSGATPDRDRSDPASYQPGLMLRSGYNTSSQLYVPADYRTTASSDGPAVYAYWGEGGMSWAAPWLAGLITLGMQVNPDLTPAKAYAALTETAFTMANGTRVVNPAGFIARVQQK